MGVPECLLAVCWEGQKRSREIMPAFLALLWTRIDLETCSIVPDQLMPDEFIDGIPCWAFDMHVREGNRALAKFLDTDAETSRWLRDRVPTNERRGDRTNRIFGTRPLSPVSGCVGNNHMNAGENSPLIDICNRFQIWAHRRSLVPHRCHPFHTLECATFVCYTF